MGEAADPDDIAHALTEESTPDDDLGSAASLLGAIAHAPGAPVLLRPGQVLAGKYRIARMLGQGGMGVVYLARDTRLDREVAVKLGTALTRSALARLEREAQALAKLSHPNVVVVHEVGEVDGRSFIAMEHVAGGTARTWVAAQPRTWREIVAVYLAAGEGLAAAHASGLVHRDIKPDNILIGDDGRPRVADFGLASGPVVSDDDRGIAGTPAYMPPEQREGHDVDGRADPYAFCAALWEALHGERYASPDAPPPQRIPRHLVAALRRGLATDREARWPELAPLLAAPGSRSPGPQPCARRHARRGDRGGHRRAARAPITTCRSVRGRPGRARTSLVTGARRGGPRRPHRSGAAADGGDRDARRGRARRVEQALGGAAPRRVRGRVVACAPRPRRAVPRPPPRRADGGPRPARPSRTGDRRARR